MTRPSDMHHADPGTAGPPGAPATGARLIWVAADPDPRPGPSAPARQPPHDHPPRPARTAQDHRPLRSWPLLILALPATVAVWSGWVGIGQLTGFGEVHPLPGIWDSLHLDTAVTLPIGVEVYAAYALRAWLSPATTLSARTRRFARWSAITSLGLGMAGQIAYHLLTQAHAARAPWGITTTVACLPVLVLGMGAALAHLIHADTNGACQLPQVPSASRPPATGRKDQELPHGDHAGHPIDHGQLAEARAVAASLAAAGQRVSRRTLRAAGLHGSNADLGALAAAARSAEEAARPGVVADPSHGADGMPGGDWGRR